MFPLFFLLILIALDEDELPTINRDCLNFCRFLRSVFSKIVKFLHLNKIFKSKSSSKKFVDSHDLNLYNLPDLVTFCLFEYI